MLRGADDLVDYCKKKLNIEINQTTLDKIFTIKTVQCLGACVNAPVVQINDDYYEDLSIEKFEEILTAMHYGMSSKVGSQIGRKSSEPFDYEIGN